MRKPFPEYTVIAPLLPVIVLVEPQHSGNLGMVARAMANFGARELRLVNPCDHLAGEARKFALHAAPLLEAATLFPDLPAALHDLHLTIATTRRSGAHREVPLTLADLPGRVSRRAPGEQVGLVFGREDSGLTSDEVAACTGAVTIPTDPDFASLNLAQAVAITLYELSREGEAVGMAASGERPTQGELEELFAQMETILTRIAFLHPVRPDLRMNRLRRIHRKAALDRREFNLLRSLWDQLGWSIRDWSGRKKVKGQE
ncbi:MAG: hypothetical protein A2091_00855 [Desulfuromonadales bacterium GWD2_61_12]|nr:MAG: hypothetical protein A2005_02265 [Desulfuromonadales bacterium GWC2_61_20]OGR36260.1 MAG: hypothetical protein A2091_00855 [Desulfuromonadales bacterium GWD2_61_12]